MNPGEISLPIFGEGFVIDPPNAISIFGFNIYLYGLFLTAGFIFAGLYMYKRRDMLGLTKDNVLDLIILAVPCGIVGARIYYALFNFADYFGPGNWLNIFKVREGGLAIYGGVIGGVVAFFVYSRVKKIPVGKLLDAAAFGLLIGQALGRWGNFFNREAHGSETDLPWKMGLASSTGGTIYVHPTFLYESLWNVVGLVVLHVFSKKRKTAYHGQYFLLYMAWYGLGRYMIEGLRTDSLYIMNSNIRVSQLLAAVSLAVAVVLLLRNGRRKKAALLIGGGTTTLDGDGVSISD
ncbi:MAG: prolipoprotein diacylglyceryl transferase [Oscillospiraceae bacterium]|nr:prolipoprotein diacylglyceryl transferase [Oscillospiraceae bacterium]